MSEKNELQPWKTERCRFETKTEMAQELTAWATVRNAAKAGTRWQFTTDDARVKLQALYPIPDIKR